MSDSGTSWSSTTASSVAGVWIVADRLVRTQTVDFIPAD